MTPMGCDLLRDEYQGRLTLPHPAPCPEGWAQPGGWTTWTAVRKCLPTAGPWVSQASESAAVGAALAQSLAPV